MVTTDDWLPLGSVVHIEGREGLYFIIGFMQVTEGGVWDYAARPYPVGYVDEGSDIYFDRDAIDGLYALGLQDLDEVQHQNYLRSCEPALEELRARVAAGASPAQLFAETDAPVYGGGSAVGTEDPCTVGGASMPGGGCA